MAGSADYGLLDTAVPYKAAIAPIQGATYVNQLAAQQLQNQASNFEMQNALAAQEAYRQAAAGNGDVYSNLMKVGRGDAAAAYAKSQAEISKFGAQAKKDIQSVINDKLKNLSFAVPNSPDEAALQIDAQFKDPDLKAFFDSNGLTRQGALEKLSAAVNANQFENWVQQRILGLEKMTDFNIRQQNAATGAANAGIAQQRLGISQGELDLRQQQSRMGNIPQGYRMTPEGNMEQIPGAPELKGQSNIGAIPSGYRLTPEGNLEAIPGGPTTQNLSAKDRQKREADYPKAKSTVEDFEARADILIGQLRHLKEMEGLESAVGPISSSIKTIFPETADFETELESIKAQGGFSELISLKNSNGSLGPASNLEHQLLGNAFGNLSLRQSPKQFKTNADEAITALENGKQRMRKALDETYAYRTGDQGTSDQNTPAPAPAPAPSTNGFTVRRIR